MRVFGLFFLKSASRMDFLGGSEDTWEEESDNSDNDSDFQPNEEPLEDINPEFVNNILNVKHSLYDNTILEPEVETNKAQNNEVLQSYLDKINKVYMLAITAQNGKRNAYQLEIFPKDTRQIIQTTLQWIEDYFSKNQIPDTIPYSDFIRKSLHEYQFVQDKSFMYE